ncbi:low temperature requirement protein A [Streptomyces sp. VRA16 Mangrove soil]|uniref:low temperature requirement protein A n=1 Tax=Streptomyces sp. VRA16 Mangrove soil TaxID=2817434 RepID=UPI001A9EEB35|nr:low temperature requirement protein A [Streptomyces sp. VRA16 Mangrove soil]MBO1329963.1 low temperature requirement protein A [Streptomyces sp. VRA16 Mangrove soil]
MLDRMDSVADQPSSPSAEAGAQERHASWIELFFDLVVVAGIGALSHLLHDAASATDVYLYAVLYLAFWTAWAAFAMYGNLAGDKARTTSMLAAMALLAVMVAAVPEIRGPHAVAFALAYAGLRVLADRMWGREQVVVDWPLMQLGFGITPWVVSVFVAGWWRYGLWGVGVAVDLAVMFTMSSGRMGRAARQRAEHIEQAHPEVAGTIEISELHSDTAHLAERLGLYVIIVLGEGLIQVIDTASETEWDLALVGVATGAFVLLVAIWTLAVRYGYAAVPHLSPTRLPVRIAMALHCFSTAALAVVVTSLGSAVAHPHGELPAHVRWLLCAGTALYFAVGALTGALLRMGWRWLLGSAMQCTLAPLVVGLAGGGLGAAWVVWLMTAVAAWQVLWLFRPALAARRREHRGGDA